MRSLIDISELTVEELDRLINTANDIIENPKKYSEKCHGKKLATLFFEPSTRTRLHVSPFSSTSTVSPRLR